MVNTNYTHSHQVSIAAHVGLGADVGCTRNATNVISGPNATTVINVTPAQNIPLPFDRVEAYKSFENIKNRTIRSLDDAIASFENLGPKKQIVKWVSIALIITAVTILGTVWLFPLLLFVISIFIGLPALFILASLGLCWVQSQTREEAMEKFSKFFDEVYQDRKKLERIIASLASKIGNNDSWIRTYDIMVALKEEKQLIEDCFNRILKDDDLLSYAYYSIPEQKRDRAIKWLLDEEFIQKAHLYKHLGEDASSVVMKFTNISL